MAILENNNRINISVRISQEINYQNAQLDMKCSDIINKRIVSNYLHLIFDKPYVILSAIFVLDIACCITQRNMHYLEMIGNDGLINAMC